jgi:protocatechuate 3,4-dioxygenase beta subunit
MSRRRVVAGTVALLGILMAVWLVRRPGPERGSSQRREPADRGAAALRPAEESPGQPATVEGVVHDAAGRPVVGALIALSREPEPNEGPFAGRRPVATATSTENGRFRFPDVRPGKYLATAAAPVGGPAQSPPFTVKHGETRSLTLTMAAAGHLLSGQVLDSGGGAVAGAIVTAMASNYGLPSGGVWPVFQAKADDRGHYRLMLLPGEARVRAEASGYAPAEQPVAVSRAVVQNFQLHPAARVSGRVIERSSGRPVADAEVRLTAVSMRSFVVPRQKRTDTDGRFAFDDADAGSFQVIARRGRLVGTSAVIRIVEAEAIADLEIAADPAAAISGRAVDEQGNGVADAKVMFFPSSGTPLSGMNVQAGSDGSFRAEGVLPGTYGIRAEATDAAMTVISETVTVGRSDVQDVKVVLGRGAIIAGKVLSADGRPAAQVRIGARVKGGRSFLRPVSSADDGSFRLAGVGGGPVTIDARSAVGGIAQAEVPPVAPGQTATVTLRLGPAPSLTGTVKRPDGRPAAGVAVAVTGQGPGLAYDSTNTDTEGSFTITSLPPGRYTVWARRKGGPMNISTSRERADLKIIEISAIQPNVVQLTVGAGGKSIGGTVTMADGKPAPGTVIVANQEEGDRSWKPDGFMATDVAAARPDGTFLIEDIDDGTFRLWAQRPGFPDTEVKNVAAGRRDLHIQLRSPASAAGVVTGADGKPVTMFTLSIASAPTGDSSPAARLRASEGARPPVALQDPRGAFVADDLEAGTYDLKVTSFDGGVGKQRITLAAGERKQGLRLVIQTGSRVTGKVVELEGGAPIAGARVGGRVAGRSVDATTRADGTFELTNLAAGDELNLDVRLHTSEDLVPEYRQVEVPATGATVDLGLIRLMRVQERWFERSRDGVGVGLMAKAHDGRPTIDRVRAESPAEKAGLKTGDLILNIDGRDVSAFGPGAVQWLLTGKPGTSVTVTAQSPGGEPRRLTITRVPPSPPKS